MEASVAEKVGTGKEGGLFPLVFSPASSVALLDSAPAGKLPGGQGGIFHLQQQGGSDLLRCDCCTKEGANNTGSLCLGGTQRLLLRNRQGRFPNDASTVPVLTESWDVPIGLRLKPGDVYTG